MAQKEPTTSEPQPILGLLKLPFWSVGTHLSPPKGTCWSQETPFWESFWRSDFPSRAARGPLKRSQRLSETPWEVPRDPMDRPKPMFTYRGFLPAAQPPQALGEEPGGLCLVHECKDKGQTQKTIACLELLSRAVFVCCA